MLEIHGLPGAERILQGLSDLHANVTSPEAFLVSIASGRLGGLGFEVPKALSDPELGLYRALAERLDDAYGCYNAWLRDLSSFLEAAERQVRG